MKDDRSGVYPIARKEAARRMAARIDETALTAALKEV